LKTKEDQGEKQKGLHKPKRIKERNRKVFCCSASPRPPPALRTENQRELNRKTERSSAVQPHLALLLC
jgi:hypothetical protein